jgi:hypothetical protein
LSTWLLGLLSLSQYKSISIFCKNIYNPDWPKSIFSGLDGIIDFWTFINVHFQKTLPGPRKGGLKNTL